MRFSCRFMDGFSASWPNIIGARTFKIPKECVDWRFDLYKRQGDVSYWNDTHEKALTLETDRDNYRFTRFHHCVKHPRWNMAGLSLQRAAMWSLSRLAFSHMRRMLCRDWLHLTRLNIAILKLSLFHSFTQSVLNWNESRSAQSKSTQLSSTCSASLIVWAKLRLVWAMLTVSEQTRVHPEAACWLVETDSMLRDRASHTELAQP